MVWLSTSLRVASHRGPRQRPKHRTFPSRSIAFNTRRTRDSVIPSNRAARSRTANGPCTSFITAARSSSSSDATRSEGPYEGLIFSHQLELRRRTAGGARLEKSIRPLARELRFPAKITGRLGCRAVISAIAFARYAAGQRPSRRCRSRKSAYCASITNAARSYRARSASAWCNAWIAPRSCKRLSNDLRSTH